MRQQRQPKLGHPFQNGAVLWQRRIDYLDTGQQFQQNRTCLHTRFQSIESVLPSWMNGYPGKYPRFQFRDLEQVIVGDKEPGKIGAGCAIFLVDIVASYDGYARQKRAVQPMPEPANVNPIKVAAALTHP